MAAYLFFKLLFLSLTGSASVLLIWLFVRIAGKRFSAKWNYFLWLAALLFFLVPLAFPAAKYQAPALPQPSPPMLDAAAPLPVALPPVSVPSPDASLGLYVPLLAVWGMGVLLLGLRRFIFRHQLRRQLKAGAPPVSALEQRVFEQAKASLHLNRRIALRRCAGQTTPFVYGLFRPIVCLPCAGLTEKQLYPIFLHELTHVKRGDLFYKSLSQLVCILHFFNPAAYLLRREMGAWCELACDETAVRSLALDHRREYGHCLLQLMRGASAPSSYSLGFSRTKRITKRRILIIMGHTSSASALTAALFFSFCLLTCTAAACGINRCNQTGAPVKPVSLQQTAPPAASTPPVSAEAEVTPPPPPAASSIPSQAQTPPLAIPTDAPSASPPPPAETAPSQEQASDPADAPSISPQPEMTPSSTPQRTSGPSEIYGLTTPPPRKPAFDRSQLSGIEPGMSRREVYQTLQLPEQSIRGSKEIYTIGPDTQAVLTFDGDTLTSIQLQ